MTLDENFIRDFKEYTRKERTCDDVCQKFNMSILDFFSLVDNLRSSGINIIVSGVGDSATILNLDERNLNGDNIYTLDENILDNDTLRALLISDTRLGSKYQQLTRLNNAYLEAWNNGYETAFMLGDISEGLYSLKNPYYDMLFADTTEKQVKYIVDNYPYIEGMKTYFITGDQDLTHTKKNGVDIGRLISEQRDDMIYLGNMRCLLNIKKSSILAQHLKVGAFDRSKIVSYKPQTFIESMRSENKVDMILDGHLLNDEQLTQRGVHEISVPSLTSTSPRIMSNGIPHNVGYVLLDMNLTKDGKYLSHEATFAPFYQTNKDDYNAVRTLKLGGKR